ncbi:hypothetical protein ACETK8_11915 [Brevundimonas staleyi]|uniref:Uncharacterized protein n=1 Tax=Brevundimonas staleyi TaxID=74326 RepID=A0ABW0FU99_9CAUL
MDDPKQSEGRRRNGAAPGGKPEPGQDDADVERVGRAARRSAGPDGPEASEIGDTFKKETRP